MYFVTPPPFARVLHSRRTWWKLPVTDKKIFLTFDDGPVPEVTPLVLNILDEFRVKAAFFCVGENVFHYHPLFQEVIKRGHQCGNHTYNHLNGWKTSTPQYLDNVEKCRQLIDSSLFRPPHGKLRRSQMKALSAEFQIIQWSVLSYDFDKSLSEEKCLKNTLDHLEPGNIFVFHDSLKAKKNVIKVLPRFLESAMEKGFTFEPLSIPSL
ncbi:MAG: polysaccharide deacetylase family protein [Bacteroidetes bacterium]|nr:polysaccharide deacetylase family protein [Bacteroidota bacterium]